MSAGKLTVTKPYGDSGTGKPYVAFTAPIVRAGQTTGAISGAVALDGIKDVIKAIRHAVQHRVRAGQRRPGDFARR